MESYQILNRGLTFSQIDSDRASAFHEDSWLFVSQPREIEVGKTASGRHRSLEIIINGLGVALTALWSWVRIDSPTAR